jgi:toluene monooxygenase system ferredoxin subunit
MPLQRVCTLDELWEGEMAAFEVNGHDVLLLWPLGGEIKAYQGICPHQETPLADGKFDGRTLTCGAHLWQFDACTGKGVNPANVCLAEYPITVEGEEVFIETAGVQPLFAKLDT